MFAEQILPCTHPTLCNDTIFYLNMCLLYTCFTLPDQTKIDFIKYLDYYTFIISSMKLSTNVYLPIIPTQSQYNKYIYLLLYNVQMLNTFYNFHLHYLFTQATPILFWGSRISLTSFGQIWILFTIFASQLKYFRPPTENEIITISYTSWPCALF